jgi:hypothetical protein
MARVVECLASKHEAKFNPHHHTHTHTHTHTQMRDSRALKLAQGPFAHGPCVLHRWHAHKAALAWERGHSKHAFGIESGCFV